MGGPRRRSRRPERGRSGSQPAPAAPVAAPGVLTVAERRQLRAAYLQGGTAVIALVISTYAFVQQLDLNRDQQILNDYAQRRDERKYSSRVAIWSAVGESIGSTRPAGLDLFIQNRSPSPLRDVQVFADLRSGRAGDVTLTDIPPCTIEVHRIAPPTGEAFVRAGQRRTGYRNLSLEFRVDGRRWQLTSERLSEVRRPRAPGDRLRSFRIDNDPETVGGQVEDCGEGG